MSTRSPARSGLTGLYLSLLAYGALFGLLQLKILPALGWSEGVVLLVCSLAASAVPLVWSRFVPAPQGPRPLFLPGAGQLVFLLSVSLTGNLVLMLVLTYEIGVLVSHDLLLSAVPSRALSGGRSSDGRS